MSQYRCQKCGSLFTYDGSQDLYCESCSGEIHEKCNNAEKEAVEYLIRQGYSERDAKDMAFKVCLATRSNLVGNDTPKPYRTCRKCEVEIDSDRNDSFCEECRSEYDSAREERERERERRREEENDELTRIVERNS